MASATVYLTNGAEVAVVPDRRERLPHESADRPYHEDASTLLAAITAGDPRSRPWGQGDVAFVPSMVAYVTVAA